MLSVNNMTPSWAACAASGAWPALQTLHLREQKARQVSVALLPRRHALLLLSLLRRSQLRLLAFGLEHEVDTGP